MPLMLLDTFWLSRKEIKHKEKDEVEEEKRKCKKELREQYTNFFPYSFHNCFFILFERTGHAVDILFFSFS